MADSKAQGGMQKVSDHDVIYALRTVHQNQTQLNILADQKANILIGIVAVILTIICTNASFLASMENQVLMSFVTFLVMEMMALCFALFVIMPKTVGRSKGMTIDNMPNPLFFGFFTKFKEDEFVSYISKLMISDDAARRLLEKDMYQMGVVLNKKYMLLKAAYIFAVMGLFLLIFSMVVDVFVR